MGEEFEDRDLSESVFWGVNLQNTTFRDANVSGSTFFHTLWNNVSIDGVVDGLVINGVDVTEYVNRNDRWYPLRTQLEPQTREELVTAWQTIDGDWAKVIAWAKTNPEKVDVSVNGEWSLLDTFRHLLFAMDKWFSVPVMGESSFTECALPNTGSQGREWPGLELSAAPSFDQVLALRTEHSNRFAQHIRNLDIAGLPETVEVPENGTVPTLMCFHVVLEEEFEHLRYMIRDLSGLGFN